MAMQGANGHTAARVRAARGYAGLQAKELAAQLNISVETMSRIENGHRAPSLEERQRIAEICGVPPAFMEEGFPTAHTPTRTISDLQTQLDDLSREVVSLAQAVATLQKQGAGTATGEAADPGAQPGDG